MEQKQKKKQKKIYVMLAILIVIALAFIGLAASGTITNWVAQYESQKNYEELIANKDNVTDEMTLRQLLLLDEELEITVTEDIVVKVGFTVNGTKTLRGDATIASNLGIFQPISILEVSNDASLTMDGLVIDGNANAIGIKVSEKGELTYLSGEIIYAGTYGILSNGLTTIEDVSISNCITAAIDAGFKGKVYFNGGELVNNRHIGVYVEAQGYMEINDGAVIDGTSGQGIRNRGELVINGGKFNDIGRFVVTNHGMLTIDSVGNDEGYIEMTNIGSGVVYNNNTGTSVVKDVHATNLGTDAMKCVGGTMTVENCIFENSGAHGFYISYGEVVIKDVKATNMGACGIYTISKANITLENVELENIKTRGIMSKGSTITGSNVTIKNAGTHAISNERSSDGTPANAEYTNLNVSGSGANNVFNGGEGTTVTIKDSVLNETPRTNVYVGNGELTLDNVEILGSASEKNAAISIASKGTCNLSGNSKIHGNGIRGVNISGVFNMKGGEIYGFYPQKQSGGAVRLYKGGVFNMSGGTIHDNKTKYAAGAVFLNSDTTFNMTGGKIYGNTAETTSGAVQISINSTFNMKGGEIYNNQTLVNSGGALMVQGVMNMSGGEIYKNTSASVGGAINLNSRTDSKTGKKVYGEFNLTGGKLYENVATANGGALHVSSGTTANLSGGKMYDNVARKGTGVNDNGNATVSGTFDLGNDTFTLGGTKIVVRIKGDKIGSHSASNPFRLEPGNYSDIGVIAAECDSAAAATAINKIIAPQTGSYKLRQSENNIVVGGYTVANMSMKGADTVYVSNFQELKAAVEGTTSSRNVVIRADIVMEGLVTVPDGTTVKLTDDGNKRTLSRKDNVVSAFFTASFGTGLIVDATKEGNLVFDGDGTNDAGKEFVQLMVVRGTTVVDGVVYKDNGAEGQTRDGAFILQKYGDITISDSSFTGAYGLTGGAVTITVGTANITNSIFAHNAAKYNAGALRVSKEANVTVTDCTFKNNSATTVGGAINCDGGKLTVVDSVFENNTSVGTSGAINLTNGAVATVEGSTITGNKSTADDAGAIKVNKSSLELTDSIISNNSTVDAGGALYVSGSSSLVTVTGGTFADNVSATTGGAIKAESGTNITLNGTTFEGNTTAGTTGGAIDAYKATITAEDCIFRDNESVTHGGAIYLNTESNATLTKCKFYSNSAISEKGYGGALSGYKSTVKVSDSLFEENKAYRNGGAIYVTSGMVVIAEDSEFVSNYTSTWSGGAIYNKGGFTAEGCTFEDNKAGSSDGATAGTNSGGAIDANSTTEIGTTVSDCTFVENSASTTGKDIYIRRGTTVTINGGTFTDSEVGYQANNSSANMGQAIIEGDFGGNVTFIYSQANKAGIVISENGITGNAITISPKAYIKGHVLVEKSDTTTEETLKAATKLIKIADNGDDLEWGVESDGTIKPLGTLQVNIAQNATTGVKYTSIQAAVNAAENGEVIYILYDMKVEEATTISDDKNVIITNAPSKNVMLIRAFEGSLFTVEDGSTLTLGSTDTTNTFVVDGGTVSGASLVQNAGTFNLAVNTTIQNANAGSNKGGALYNTGTATLSGTMTGNTATHGGAVYNTGNVTVKAGTYSYNIATNGGGVIYSDNNASYVNVEAGTFEYNEAQGGTSGVIYGKATTTITGGTFQYNKAKTGGGVMNVAGSCTAFISNATMTGNALTASSYAGGAIYVSGKGTLNVENSTISGNATDYKSNTNPGCDISLGANVALNLKNNTNIGVVQQRYNKAVATINVLETYTSAIAFIPYNNTPVVDAQFVVFADTMSDEAKTTSAANMLIRQYTSQTEYNDKAYYIDADGCLRQNGVKIGETYYKTLSEAVANVSTASEEATVIEVLTNETLSEPITLLEGQKVVLQNTTDAEVKLTRDAASVDSMFAVVVNSSLTIDGTSAIVLDGGYVSTDTSTTTVKSLIQNAGTLILGANVTVQNANSKATSDPGTDKNEYKAGALYNTGTVTLSGNFTGNTGWNGGAIYSNGGSIAINGGTYSNNNANKNGGAIATVNNTTISNAEFKNNTSSGGGGAVYLYASSAATLSITDTNFAENKSTGSSGGAIYCNKELIVNGGTFYRNSASTYGGVVNVAGTADISNAKMYENAVGTNERRGAAIYVSGNKTLTLTDCNIFNNTYLDVLCDIAFSNQATYNKATISGIVANDGDDSVVEYCYVNIGSTKYYVGIDGSTLTKVE